MHQASQLTSGADLTLSSGGSVVFDGVLDLHQESHEKSKSSWAWQSAKGQGNTDQTLIQSQLQAQGELIIRAAEGVQIDVREINQQTVSQTIDAMVAAEPGLAWLKEMEARGDVDWRHVKEVHDSFSYSHSGLGAGAQLVIAIVVAAMVGPGASALAGGGTAGAVTGAVATSAATNAVVSTVNNRGDLGAVFDDITSSDAVKGYVVAGATAGLTAGVYDNLLGTKTNELTGQVVVDLSTVEGVGRFAANQALQGSTSTALYRALGEDSDFSQVLGNALVNTFAAYGFNLVGDLGDRYQLPSGSAEKVVLHALMGGLAAEAYGGDFASGALVAGVNELVVADLNAQFAGLPDEQRTALLVMSSQLIGVLSAALLDPDGREDQLETGAWVAANATNYNFLNHADMAEFVDELDRCQGNEACQFDVWQGLGYDDLSLENQARALDTGGIIVARDTMAQIAGGLDVLMAVNCSTVSCETYKSVLTERALEAYSYASDISGDFEPALAMFTAGIGAGSRVPSRPPGSTPAVGSASVQKAVDYLAGVRGAKEPTRFIDGVKVVDQKTGQVLQGTVDLGPTLDRIKSGGSFPHRNDGSIFQNRAGDLPQKPAGYYTEYVHPTPGVSGPGPQRIVVGKGGEMYYTADHYKTFVPINK